MIHVTGPVTCRSRETSVVPHAPLRQKCFAKQARGDTVPGEESFLAEGKKFLEDMPVGTWGRFSGAGSAEGRICNST